MNTPRLQAQSASFPGIALPVFILLTAFAIRIVLLWQNAPLDVDEALFASFARAISHDNNPLLHGLPVDKPPLTFYINALSFKLLTNPTEWAARLPNILASTASVVALWALGIRLYNRRTAAFAALILASSPLDSAFAGSAFTDPQANLWVLLACLMAIHKRWGLSGVLLGVGFASKQSALQMLPLILMLGWIHASPRPRHLLSFAAGLTITCALPFLWQTLRLPADTSWWALGAANNAPDRIIRSDELVPRIEIWLSHIVDGFGSPLIPALMLPGAPGLIRAITKHVPTKAAAANLALVTFSAAYVLLYVLGAFNVYSRYATPLIPLFALLSARVLDSLCQRLSTGLTMHTPILVYAVLILLSASTLSANARGKTPLSESRSEHEGIREVAAFLNTLPAGTIVYDHWAGWLLGWYTGQQRPEDMWLRITYYPTPEHLVADFEKQRDPRTRYFVVPRRVNPAPWLSALRETGFQIAHDQRFGRYDIYSFSP